MPAAGKCPKCEQLVTHLDVTKPDVHAPSGKTLHGAAFLCPHCQTILGAGADPVALLNDLAALLKGPA